MSKVATRDRILDAALQVFARKGYHRAIVDDIVRASGTSKGAVYPHFPNTKVECALTAALATFAADERLVRLILLEAVSLGPTYQAPLDTRVVTLAWLGAVNEIVVQWLHGALDDVSTTIPALTRMLLRSIGARGA